MATARHTRRRLFVFCDGTWHDGVNSGLAPTNVATLARCLKPVADDGYLQISYYDSGVGNGTSKVAQLIDGATGRGISAKIRNAYSFLSHNYNFADGSKYNEIYLVGFSRGAFAVQCLASFISQTGLLRSVHLYFLRGLFTLWSHQKLKPELDRAVEDLKTVLHEVSIKALVVYDSVSALGLPSPFAPRPLSFVGNQVPKIVQHAFQALALDERRPVFEPVVWKSVEKSDSAPPAMKQCWFLGSHADVGGNGDAALGALTLLWVVGLLRKHTGVAFEDEELVRHLKHRLLEWDVRVRTRSRGVKEKPTLSTMPNSGKSTDAGMYWGLMRLKSRRSFLQDVFRNPNNDTTIHFTVRLAMATKRSKCRLLVTHTTRTDQGGGGTATTAGSMPKWFQPETHVGVNEDPVSDKEKVLLEAWTKIGTDEDPARMQEVSNRDRFIAARLINETNDKGEEVFDEQRASFAEFLRNYMVFDAVGVPSPEIMYPLVEGHR